MDKDKIIKEFEKSAGYRVCYWCSKSIQRGNRIMFLEEFEDSEGWIKTKSANKNQIILCPIPIDSFLKLNVVRITRVAQIILQYQM